VLTSVATAYAECVWVLWVELSQVDSKSPAVWIIVSANPTQAKCDTALNKKIEDATQGQTNAKRNANIITEHSSGGLTTTWRYSASPTPWTRAAEGEVTMLGDLRV